MPNIYHKTIKQYKSTKAVSAYKYTAGKLGITGCIEATNNPVKHVVHNFFSEIFIMDKILTELVLNLNRSKI